MTRRTLWLLVPMLAISACASDPPRDPMAGALTSEEPPADFSLGLTIVAPPPTAQTARAAVPARYIVQSDWLLRASTSEPTELAFPALTRQLSHQQARQLWWELRDSGLLDAERPPDFSSVPPVPAAGSPPAYIVSTTIAGRTRRLVLGAADATSAESAAARRLADRLATLAWVER